MGLIKYNNQLFWDKYINIKWSRGYLIYTVEIITVIACHRIFILRLLRAIKPWSTVKSSLQAHGISIIRIRWSHNQLIFIMGIPKLGCHRICIRSRNWGCLVTWFCYQLIAKPGNKTAAVPWPGSYLYWGSPVPTRQHSIYINTIFAGTGHPIMRIRQSHDHIIFIIIIPILV